VEQRGSVLRGMMSGQFGMYKKHVKWLAWSNDQIVLCQVGPCDD
jgi:hypothetical protein